MLPLVMVRLLVSIAVLASLLPSRPEVAELDAPTTPAQDLIVAVNTFRAQHGLTPLAPDPRLQTAAQGHVLDMAQNNYFGHVGSDGATYQERSERVGYIWSEIGENLAGGAPDASFALNLWTSSPSHLDLLLKPSLRHVGVGFAYDADDQANVQLPGGAVSGPFYRYWALLAGSVSGEYPIVLDFGQPATDRRTVQLAIPGLPNDGTSEYRLSEQASCGGALWQAYALGQGFMLSAGNGIKTVYGQVRFGDGRVIDATPASIELNGPSIEVSQDSLTFLVASGGRRASPQIVRLRITTEGFDSVPILTAVSDSAWLSAAVIGGQLEVQVIGLETISAGEHSATVTVTDTAGFAVALVQTRLLFVDGMLRHAYLPRW